MVEKLIGSDDENFLQPLNLQSAIKGLDNLLRPFIKLHLGNDVAFVIERIEQRDGLANLVHGLLRIFDATLEDINEKLRRLTAIKLRVTFIQLRYNTALAKFIQSASHRTARQFHAHSNFRSGSLAKLQEMQIDVAFMVIQTDFLQEGLQLMHSFSQSGETDRQIEIIEKSDEMSTFYFFKISMKTSYPDAKNIQEAAEGIHKYIQPSQIYTDTLLNEQIGASLFFKMENLIPEVFAFKVRGALNAALRLTEEERQRGLVAHSSGNHGGAVAWVAKQLGIPAYIAVPHTITDAKRANILRHGAQITECEPFGRDAAAKKLQEETGGAFIHPYENWEVITGQATAALEMHQQVPHLESLIVPVGGGGLLAGTLLATQYFSPTTEVFAGEPEKADDAYRSLIAGSIQENTTVETIADGLRSQHLGSINFPIIQQYVRAIIRVSEEEILEAQKLLQERLKCAIEPSSAVAYAAIAKERENFRNKRVGILITGGNVESRE